ncbi:MAG: hypothetical protein HOV66_09840 [Streptomycetaceae bacterium]|nr:hypothetical protein [Streptomycetaceae bacterium]
MVTVRGPGQGTDGYCWLAATTDNTSTTGPWNSTLPGTLQGPTTAADLPPTLTPAEAEAALVPSRRTVTVRVTPTPDPQVTVDVDFGSGAQRVLAMAAPQPVPATYKFGFAASTGLFTDVHLIRHVTAHSLVALPRLNLVKQIDRSTPLPDPVVAGTAVPYEFVVTNAGNVPVDNLAVTDPTVGAVTCPVATLAVGATTTCHGTYTVTAADVQRGYVANTAVAHGTADGDRVESPESKVTLPLDDTYGLLLTKHVDDSKHYAVGDHATYTYTVTNTTDAQVTDLAVHDDRLTGITCEATTLTPRETPGAVTTCTGTYVVTEADAATGHIGNTAYATGTTPNRDVSSPPDSANIVVAGPSPSPSPTPTHTHTYTPRPTPTHTHRPRPTPTPTPTETCTPAATPTPTETHSPEPTHTYTHGPKPTPTHTYTHGPKPTPTHTRSVKPTPTPTRTCAPGPTPTAGPTATSSPCPESTGPHPTYPTRPPRTAYPVAPGGPGPGSGPAVADRIPTTGSGPAAQLVGLAAVLLIVGGVLMELTRKRRSRRSRP